jgi:signal transduction histidine kinase
VRPGTTGDNALGSAEFDQTFSATTYTRLSAVVRLVACFAVLHIAFFLDPISKPSLVSPLIVVLTLLFSIYAAILYWRSVRDQTFQERQIVYWTDVMWYLAIIFVAGSPGSQFFFFLSFPLLFASLRWGFKVGIVISVFASVILLGIGMLRASAGVSFLNASILLPPTGLMVLGYLMATWADSDLTLNRRLASLKEFHALFNPRFSIEQLSDRVVRHLAKLHQIEKFALVLQESGRPPKVFRADLPDAMYQVSDTTAFEIASLMRALNTNGALVYCSKRGILPAEAFVSEANAAKRNTQIAAAGMVAVRFDCLSFCSVQFKLRDGGSARLFVWSDRHYFGLADLPFFHQLGEQLAPRIENVQLLDRLASEVADAERQKISRDIHDSAIQPYLGLKFALEALTRKVPAESPLYADIERMVEMATSEITELRTFVKGLRGDEDSGRAALVPAVRRQAVRFGELYGITVVVDSPSEMRIGDNLANEAFHIVSEALSNIRRHTTASRARIQLSFDEAMFTLRVTNPCEQGAMSKLFTPRSIAERANALGGACRVATVAGGDTEVTVEIPLRNTHSISSVHE